MLRSILVGLDGSEDCQAAVNLGMTWAKRFDALLVAVGVIDEPTIRGSQRKGEVSPTYKAAYEQLLAEARRNVESDLGKFAIRCSENQVACKLLEDEGRPCEKILDELQRYDLLMLGCKTHFQHGSQAHPCKTLESVLRDSSRPIVAVPAAQNASGNQGVLVAYDGSVQAARALQAFLATGLKQLGPIQIVSVHSSSSVEAARIADRAAEYLRFHGVEATCNPVVDLRAAGMVFLELAEKTDAGLIVMGAYGQPKMRDFFFGSATRWALQHSSVPLMLFH